jgi:hypothetical protein
VRKGGQASSEDLLPLGYGERDRVRVRVKRLYYQAEFTLSFGRFFDKLRMSGMKGSE